MIEKSHIDKILSRLSEIETELSKPDTAANRNRFRDLVREHARLTRIRQLAGRYFSLVGDIAENKELLASDDGDEELKQLAGEELAEAEEALSAAEKELMISLLPPDPDDERNAIVEIRAGTGGDEAALFAGDLFRMYSRYTESRKWTIKMLDARSSEVGGYKEVVFQVGGRGVYGCMRYECGTHRVQRVPTTESQGRVHTSAATVAVFPEADKNNDFEIAQEEVRVDIYRASGPGGQSVNTTDSAVRLTHIPTGIVVQCQDEKSQHRNKEAAMSVLKSRVMAQKKAEEAARRGDARRAQIGSGDRSERIRTYNFPQNRLTDHRINLTLYSLDQLIEGDIGGLIDSLRDRDLEDRLAEELG